ncbi:MAG TPA: hypothetical protein VLM79_10365 [Kofleriaceae bacterium]|nr:hypothetical protein [Kofleriaceae bacterium]
MFLVGAGSLVSASPVREENTERVSYNERRTNAAKPKAEPGWVELASATPASHGREFVEVGADAGAFTQLRLSAASGRSGIRAVRVDYQDGSRRTFEIERVLAPKSRPVYVDLRGSRELRQVIVMTDRDSRGSYRLEGNTLEASVANR